ncbi:MAG TPA: hypothetical protein VFN88_02025 [Caulobacteraceae bacterium]|nr:hypothetical protein [Caulobacteraceae bacterium]
MPAIVGALQEFVEAETERLRAEWEATLKRRRQEEQQALEDRFLAGADCKWTTINKSKDFFTRKNGRAYRLSRTKDDRWELYRIESTEDAGSTIGTYRSRGDASRALVQLAYRPEPRW